MKAFHNDSSVKAEYLSRVEAHRAADQLAKGFYWEEGRGCAVGCTIHSDDHSAYERELGIPQVLARLEDRIFENLPNELAMTWPSRFLSAIPVGADLHAVADRFLVWMLRDPVHGTRRLCTTAGAAATDTVTALFDRKIGGDSPTCGEWRAARNASADAAAYAAYAAASAADAYASAADAAADADAAAYAAYAAASAADAYASAATRKAAREEHFVVMSEKLLQLLFEAPVSEKPS